MQRADLIAAPLCICGLLAACGGGDGGGPELIAAPSGATFDEPRFSPDGTEIAVTVSFFDDAPEQIGIVDVASGDLRMIATAGTYLASPTWTRDGSAIIYTGDESIFRVSAAGGEPEVVLDEFLLSFAAMEPDLAPDGNRLVYRTNGGTMKIGELDTGTIVDTGEYGASPRYSPDGDVIAYLTDDAIAFDDDSAPLPVAPALFSELAWLPDGQHLVYVAESGDPDDIDDVLLEIDRTTGETEVIHQEFSVGDVDVSADGSTLAYVALGSDGVFLLSLE
jgi:Tol biopolymer transport system component